MPKFDRITFDHDHVLTGDEANRLQENIERALGTLSSALSTQITNIINGGSGGGTLGPGLNGAIQYVSPTGSDLNDGLSWEKAKRTGYAAAKYLSDPTTPVPGGQGGTVYVAYGTEWAGPIPGQGAWFTSLVGLPELGVGYLYGPPIDFIGIGTSHAAGLPTPFQGNGVAVMYGGSNVAGDYDTKPAVLLSSTFLKINFYNIQWLPAKGFEGPYNGAPFVQYRMGMDFRRNWTPISSGGDGHITSQTITQAQRSGTAGAGTTVFNVSLVGPIPIASATRALVGLTWTTTFTINPSDSWTPPWETGTSVWFTDTSGHFTSGAYVVGEDLQTTIDNTGVWGFSIVDGQTTPIGPIVNPGSISSVYAYPGGRVSVQLPGNPDFLSTSYPVIAVSATSPTTGTITVSDIYGAAGAKPWGTIPVTTGAEATPGGVLMVEEHSWLCTTGWTLENCATRACQDPAQLARMRPGVDIGATNAFTPDLLDCYLQGFYNPADPYDGFRMDAVSAQGGPRAATGFKVNGGSGQQCSFRANTAITLTSIDSVTIEQFLYDSDGTGQMPGLYTIHGNSATTVHLDGLNPSDAGPGFGPALNVITGISPLKLTGDSCSGYTGPSSAPSSAVGAIQNPATWVKGPRAGIKGNSIQLVGRHPASWRGGPPYYCRVPNYAREPESWGTAGLTGQTGPFGDSDAIQYDNTAGGSVIFHSGRDAAYGPGWYVVIAGWFCGINGGVVHSGNVSVGLDTSATGTFVAGVGQGTGGTGWTGLLDDLTDGWQFGAWYAQVATNFDNFYQARVSTPTGPGSGGTFMVFDQMTIQWFDPALYSELDIAEYIGTIKACPAYLQPGCVGTIRGQKLIGHGGLGVDTSVPVTPSGPPAAPTKNVPLFDASGVAQLYLPALPTNSPLLTGQAAQVIMPAAWDDPTAGDDWAAPPITALPTVTAGGTAGGTGSYISSITYNTRGQIISVGTTNVPLSLSMTWAINAAGLSLTDDRSTVECLLPAGQPIELIASAGINPATTLAANWGSSSTPPPTFPLDVAYGVVRFNVDIGTVIATGSGSATLAFALYYVTGNPATPANWIQAGLATLGSVVNGTNSFHAVGAVTGPPDIPVTASLCAVIYRTDVNNLLTITGIAAQIVAIIGQ